jgi:hypothetical protein
VKSAADLAQDAVGRPGRLPALSTGLEVTAHLHANISFFLCGLQNVPAHGVLLALVVTTNMHDFAFFCVEGHPPSGGPLHEFVETFLQSRTVLRSFDDLA